MNLWGHRFDKYGEQERICWRCGYVIGHGLSEDETKDWIKSEEGCELHCGGEWHQFKRQGAAIAGEA
jgi:hypothetical protein